MKTTNINAYNIKCSGCAESIKSSLMKLKGVSSVKVDVEENIVSVEYTDPGMLMEIKQKLEHMGYPNIDSDNTMVKKAKSYVSCMIGRMKQ